MRSPLVLTEYVPSTPVGLSVTERDALRGLVPGLTIEPVAGSTETYTITGGSLVGVVRVGNLTVELRPKVGIAPVLFLLSYALEPKAWREPRAEVARDMNLAEAIVPLFAHAAQAALRLGLLHGYRTREDTLATVRGRVRMADQMRARTGLPLPVEVVYDEFTPDILENRLLRSAVDVLGRLRLRHPASRRALARLHRQLNGVGSLIVGSREVPEPVWTRLNERYRPAVSLARLIVPTAGLEAQAGGEDASAFVVDMNAVFERFVRAALREQLRLNAKAFPAASRGTRCTWTPAASSRLSRICPGGPPAAACSSGTASTNARSTRSRMPTSTRCSPT
jgi:5-methylcytosine-specific restriction enzyme subunit McrC